MHEVFTEEFEKHRDDLGRQLATAIAERALPRLYFRHAVVANAPADCPVFPLAIYLDGVSFTRNDTVLRIWLVCLLTNRRWLLMAIRKSDTCKCGCRGWCSLHPLFSVLAWSSVALAEGAHPWDRHDARGYPGDGIRTATAGHNLGYRGAILFIIEEWAEYANTLGFPTWASLQSLCLVCRSTLASVYDLGGVSVLSLPWPPKTYADLCCCM